MTESVLSSNFKSNLKIQILQILSARTGVGERGIPLTPVPQKAGHTEVIRDLETKRDVSLPPPPCSTKNFQSRTLHRG